MDKIKIFLITIIGIIAIGGIFYTSNKKIHKDDKKSNVVLINYSELEKKVNNKDDFVLVITQEGCSHCKNYTPVIEKVSKKYNINIYDLSLTDLSDEESKKISTIANVSGTPTTVFFKNGNEESTLNRINGETSESKLVDKLKKLGYIGD